MLLLSLVLGFGMIFFYLDFTSLCVLLNFCFTFAGNQRNRKKKELLVGEIFLHKFFLLFSFGFSYSFFCCISFGFLGTSLRASQKQLGRLLLIVLFEYFTAGIAATLRLMASLVVTPLGGGGLGYIFSALFFVCLCVRNY